MKFKEAHDRSEKLFTLLLDIKEGRKPISEKPSDLKGVSFSGKDLSGMDLSGVDLSGADLTEANLSGARLFRANLSRATLMRANLEAAELSWADLTEAILEEANAKRIGLGMACLKGAKLFRCSFDESTLSLADFEGADLRSAILLNARLRETKLTGADLTNADLRSADLSLSHVDGSTFNNADLREARLRAVSGFESANWIGVDIRDVNFAGAYRLRRFIADQNYIKEFRSANKLNAILYYVWLITSDCGRSLLRWCVCILMLAFFFAGFYTFVDIDYGEYQTWLSPFYFSVVTLTTLGYGDVNPASTWGQVIAMVEVISGYIMLGGLLSIFSNKIARRAD